MGHEIVYCARCATRLTGADFDRGKAFRAGDRIVCSACLPEVVQGLTPKEQEQVLPLSSTKMKTVKSSPSHSSHGSSVRIQHVQEQPAKSSLPLILTSVGILGVLGIAIAALSGRSSSPPPEPIPSPTIISKPPPPVDKPEDPQIREARAAVQAARQKMKSAPQDLDAQLAAWEEAVRKAALTPFHPEAVASLKEVRARLEARKPPPPVEPEKKPVVVEAPVKTSSPEVKAYLTRWEAAMAKASARDFDAALAELGRAAAELQDDAVKKDARADADLLGRARTVLADGQAAVARLSRGQSVKLRVRDEAGEIKVVQGSVVRAGAHRVELRQGDASVFVESEDVSAASLAALRGAADPRAGVVLCLLEGDKEGAEGLGEGEPLAPRYWDYAAAAAARVPKPTPREVEARNRFYAAEREFAKTETLAAAVGKYKSLADDYADTRVVKGESVRIQKRAQAGRDYVYIAGAIKGTGTFALAPAPRTEVAWVSKADIDSSLENYVEVEFAALPELTYRCWALVAGCCAETLVFYLQTTEGTDLHPKTKQRTSTDPGASLASVVKHSISGLKKLHEDHKAKGAKVHPKTPARWEWVSIPLPKYAAAGAKKVRLISDQQGFGVGAVVVSATRTGVMPEAELKEEIARVRATFAAAEPGLVAWWRLDESSGTAVSNAVEGGPWGAIVAGSPKWAPGRVGGGMKFAQGDEVRVPASFSFPAITLSAWVKHDDFSTQRQRYVSFGAEAAVIRCEGSGVHFYMRTDGDLRQIVVPGSLEAGKWTHVVGTWDGRTQKVYKDGALIGKETPGGKLGPADLVQIGADGESMHGMIDEVRIYNRALSDADVKRLFEEGTSGVIAEIGVAPPPPPGKPWRPLLTGDCIKASGSWKYDNGALAYVPGTDDAAQTREHFGDGELRIRFEVKDADRLWFAFRQGAGAYGIDLGNDFKPLEGKPHELIIVGSGDTVTATLDGKPVPVSNNGSPKSGCLQFNAKGKVARILAIDVR
jgi:hypothetical protein